MAKMSKRILFFGNERLATGVTTGAPTLKALIDGGYEIPAVVVAQSTQDKSRKARELEVAALAGEHNIPVVSLEQVDDYPAEAAVLIAFGRIISAEILDKLPAGIINVHPSLLPLHRGSTPIESVILSGETETGASLMKLVPKMDAGPIFAQQKVTLSGSETKQELADNLAELGSRMIIENLPAILDGSLQPHVQDESLATTDRQIMKTDSGLDFNKPATQLEREVRAYAGWPRSRTKLGSIEAIVTKTHVEDGSGQPGEFKIDGKTLGIYTSDGVLAIDAVIPAGKAEMSAEAFLAGYNLN